MSKKKKGQSENWNELNEFIGCKIQKFVQGDYPEIHFSNGKICKIYEEGSYSDYWDSYYSWNKNNQNTISKVLVEENQRSETITIYFVDVNGKTI